MLSMYHIYTRTRTFARSHTDTNTTQLYATTQHIHTNRYNNQHNSNIAAIQHKSEWMCSWCVRCGMCVFARLCAHDYALSIWGWWWVSFQLWIPKRQVRIPHYVPVCVCDLLEMVCMRFCTWKIYMYEYVYTHEPHTRISRKTSDRNYSINIMRVSSHGKRTS